MAMFNVERTPSPGPFECWDLSVMVETQGSHERVVRQRLMPEREPLSRWAPTLLLRLVAAQMVLFGERPEPWSRSRMNVVDRSPQPFFIPSSLFRTVVRESFTRRLLVRLFTLYFLHRAVELERIFESFI